MKICISVMMEVSEISCCVPNYMSYNFVSLLSLLFEAQSVRDP